MRRSERLEALHSLERSHHHEAQVSKLLAALRLGIPGVKTCTCEYIPIVMFPLDEVSDGSD